ncbi:MAG TPA: hypothetical protein VLI39_16405 [Sedimentisphaerales bacterium]|nr:hypothetical protein [Sedimentisphaerales bacterium]
MRIDSRQFAGSVRTAVVVTAVAALFAMTSGLLLTIHILAADHSHCHHSHDCSICQQFLILSKKALPPHAVELVQQAPGLGEKAPDFVERITRHSLENSQPRGPPCS